MSLTFAAALAVAQPGAPLLEIGSCAADRTSAVDRQLITILLTRNLGDRTAIQRLREQVVGCSPGNGDVTNDAVVAAGYLVVRGEFGRMLSRGGVDAKLVDRWFQRTSAAIQTTRSGAFEQLGALTRELIAAGAPEASVNANLAAIRHYLDALVKLERIRRGLTPFE